MNIKLKDVEITNIHHETDQIVEGCETCDFGAIYASNLQIDFSDGTAYQIATENGYEMEMSELMLAFTNAVSANINKKAFLDKVCDLLEKEYEEWEDFGVVKRKL